jgi:hypothetical protein
METLKRIHLVKKDKKTNRYLRNESFPYEELRRLVIVQERTFFNHWLYGRIRTKAIELFLGVCSRLTDIDKQGKCRLVIRK